MVEGRNGIPPAEPNRSLLQDGFQTWLCERDHGDSEARIVPVGEECPACGAIEPYESFRWRTDPPPWGQGRDA